MKLPHEILAMVLLFFFLSASARSQAATNATLPTISSQPRSRFVLVGSNVTFSVSATGSPPLKYQWFQNETLLAGETSSSLAISNVSEASRGFYHVQIRNAAGAIGSQTSYLIPYSTPAADSGGTLRFSTRTHGVFAPVTGAYGPLLGDQWAAQLYAGPSGSSESMLVPLFPPAAFGSGSLAGFVIDGIRFVPSVSPGALAAIQVRVWNIDDGDTWEEAINSWTELLGKSAVIGVYTGPDENSPSPLTGFAPFDLLPPAMPLAWASIVPSNQTAFVGSTATFTAETVRWDPNTGTYSLTNQTAFRWKRNGIVLTNATSPRLVITNVDVSDAATYYMGFGQSGWVRWIESPPYSLTVRFDPQILSIVRTPPSSAELAVRGATGATITLLISSNLTDWTPLESLECSSGTVQFVDRSIPLDGPRFYRAASE